MVHKVLREGNDKKQHT